MPRGVTPAGVRAGDPGALAGLIELRGDAVLAYATTVTGRGPARDAAAEAFSRFRAHVAVLDDVRGLQPDDLLRGAVRETAGARVPPPARAGVRRLARGRETCAWVPRLIAARANRALSPGDTARLDRHLAGCADCRAVRERFRAAEQAYGEAVHAPLPEPDARGLLFALATAAPLASGTPQEVANAALALLPDEAVQRPPAAPSPPAVSAPPPEPELESERVVPGPPPQPEPVVSAPPPEPEPEPTPPPEPEPEPAVSAPQPEPAVSAPEFEPAESAPEPEPAEPEPESEPGSVPPTTPPPAPAAEDTDETAPEPTSRLVPGNGTGGSPPVFVLRAPPAEDDQRTPARRLTTVVLPVAIVAGAVVGALAVSGVIAPREPATPNEPFSLEVPAPATQVDAGSTIQAPPAPGSDAARRQREAREERETVETGPAQPAPAPEEPPAVSGGQEPSSEQDPAPGPIPPPSPALPQDAPAASATSATPAEQP
ncbi:MAG TPA: zf-HC2 domain-containing protein [Solirubrobacteraceae bacterium]|nr:zf-HC2 domain-containing protein [Solirubrobacteraceae bacterium]